MSILKKQRVIMLPTNKATGICTHRLSASHPKLLCYHKPTWQDDKGISEGYQQDYHLYVLSDEEIKVGDWCIQLGMNRLEKWDGDTYNLDISLRRKVIASTDKSLMIEKCSGFIGKEYPLPTLRESFIEKYIQAYNAGHPIEWVNVEYEDVDIHKVKIKYNFDGEGVLGEFEGLDTKLKLRSDNTIITHPIQDSFSREEVIDVISKFAGYTTEYTKAQAVKWFNTHY